MKRQLQALRRAIADDRGVIGPAVTMLLVVVLIGAGLVFDGGRALAARREAINTAEAAARAGVATLTADGLREDPARAATFEFLDAAGVARTDVVSITVTPTTVTVVLTARRDAVFGQLIGNDSIVVRGSGEATATFGNSS
jgi:Flp pilus assembly protein TadG